MNIFTSFTIGPSSIVSTSQTPSEAPAKKSLTFNMSDEEEGDNPTDNASMSILADVQPQAETENRGEKEKPAANRGEKEKPAANRGEKEKPAANRGEKEKSAPSHGEKETVEREKPTEKEKPAANCGNQVRDVVQVRN